MAMKLLKGLDFGQVDYNCPSLMWRCQPTHQLRQKDSRRTFHLLSWVVGPTKLFLFLLFDLMGVHVTSVSSHFSLISTVLSIIF